MRSAIGIVEAMVYVPHGLWKRALMTASPSPARATTMMKRMASEVVSPPRGPI